MTKQVRGIFRACAVLAIITLLGCGPLSEQVKDKSAGMNGGFEQTESGLPVNWIVYTPETIPTGDYDLLFDQADFKEGTQSLKFLVREVGSTGGWHSPGITKQYPVTPGASYRISFWIKSQGSDWFVLILPRSRMASDRREHLLDTALSLFRTDGFHATGIDKILAKLGAKWDKIHAGQGK